MWRRRACIDCAIRHDALCGALSIDELASLARRGFRKRYTAGSVIVGGGKPQLWFANLLSGVIKLTRTLRDGRLQVVGLLFPGDFLGRPFEGRTPYAAEAATAVELCCFGRREFELFLKEHPNLKQLLLERTLDDVDAARDWMVLLGSKSAEERVATLILYLARRSRFLPCSQGRAADAFRSVALPRRDGEVPGPAYGDGEPATQTAPRHRPDRDAEATIGRGARLGGDRTGRREGTGSSWSRVSLMRSPRTPVSSNEMAGMGWCGTLMTAAVSPCQAIIDTGQRLHAQMRRC
jgi:CRP/FNR family transcriptional regulator